MKGKGHVDSGVIKTRGESQAHEVALWGYVWGEGSERVGKKEGQQVDHWDGLARVLKSSGKAKGGMTNEKAKKSNIMDFVEVWGRRRKGGDNKSMEGLIQILPPSWARIGGMDGSSEIAVCKGPGNLKNSGI